MNHSQYPFSVSKLTNRYFCSLHKLFIFNNKIIQINKLTSNTQ